MQSTFWLGITHPNTGKGEKANAKAAIERLLDKHGLTEAML